MEIHVSVKAETLWSIDLGPLGTLHITNSFLTMILVMVFILIFFSLIARKASIIPGRMQSAFEIAAQFVLDLVEGTAGRQFGRRIFPLCGALFFFIILSNYSGLLPGVGTIGKEEVHSAAEETHARIAAIERPGDDSAAPAAEEGETVLVPFLRSPSADLNMTLAMALVTFTIVQVAGVRAHGVVGRIKHMANPPFLFPIEVVSELSRIVSLSFRLFGNIFAGEVLVTVMYAMASAILEKTKYIAIFAFAIPTVFLFLEVLFGFVQALVFALLTLIYISLAAAGHDDHEEEHAHGAAHPVPHPVGSAAGD
ncbi:MAG: ATP synthase F0 subunit A [Chloroflexi bacterium]|nr:MAG: ATP synthase F0 subunit A [Chloroflexota bacterium]